MRPRGGLGAISTGGRLLAAAALLLTAGCAGANDLPAGEPAPGQESGVSGPGAPPATSTEPAQDAGSRFLFDIPGNAADGDAFGDLSQMRGLLRELADVPERMGFPGDASVPEPDPFDPCTLVTSDEWAGWAGPGGQSHIVLEHGEVCGFINGDDTRRMAIGWLPHLGGDRFLASEQRATAESATVAGHAAYWLTGWPVPQSSMLLIELEDGDLGVEMSTLGDVTDPELLAGARTFAELSLGRVP